MSESTELTVVFKTNNKNPEQELQGIFNNYWDATVVHREHPFEDVYYVRILELDLGESYRFILDVIKHCHKNKRTIYVEVTHGNIYS